MVNSSITSGACTTPVTVTPAPVFDLRLKKYINSDDAEPSAPVTGVSSGATFNYIIRVTNIGPADVSGVTTVTDTLPAGITPRENISASGWSCDTMATTQSITCTRQNTLGAGVSYPEIVVPVTLSVSSGTITNTATVTNPNENP
jgi:uncharacterized repeat protein (TIGR01451 family)